MNLFNPTISQADIDTVINTLKSGWLGKGQKVTEFEAAWARHIKADSANVVSTTSCTEALFTAVKLLGIGPGDEVIIPTIHFVGAAQAVLAVGARPVFCDVDSRMLNTTRDFIEAKLTSRTKAIILNHYGGVPCDLDSIVTLGNYGIKIIEDAACAPASIYNGHSVGIWGDIGVWSFDAMKIITTGDGGMMYIRDPELAASARQWLYLGTSSESGLSSNKARWWEFEVTQPGARRAIMNDIAAAMGLEQLGRLGEFVERRRQVSNYYDEHLAILRLGRHLPQITRLTLMGERSFYFYWIQTPRRDELAAYLKANNIYTSFRYHPLHLAYKTGDSLPNAERAARETLLLPLHCNLADEDVSRICEKIRGFYDL